MPAKIQSAINAPGAPHSVRTIASAGRNLFFDFSLEFTELFGKDSLPFLSNLSKNGFITILFYNLHCVL